MPSKCSQTVFSLLDAGRSNSVRYHQEGLKGLSFGIGISVNRCPMG